MQSALFVANVIMCPVTVAAALVARHYAVRAQEQAAHALKVVHGR